MHRLHKNYGIMGILVFGIFLSIATFKIIQSKNSKTLTAKTFLQWGEEACRKNQHQEALELYSLGVKHFPDHPLLWQKIAAMQKKQNEGEYYYALKKASALTPCDPALHAELAAFYFQKESYSDAGREMALALKEEPHNRDYLIKAAQLANIQGSYNQAVEYYKKIKQLDPADQKVEYLIQKITQNPEHYARHHLLKQTEPDVQQLNDYALLYGETAEYKNVQIENQLQKAAKEKKSAQAYFQLASHQYAQDKLERAFQSIEKALSLNAKNSNYWKLCAFIAAELGKNEAEIAAYRKIIALDPKNRQAIHALTYLAPGAFELSSIPPNLKALDFVALAEAAQKSENFSEATTLYQLGLKFFPENEALWKGVARTYKSQKESNRALASYREALKKSPNDDRLLAEVSELLLTMKNYAEALALMEKAVEIKSHNVDYLRQLAHLANLNEDYPLSQYTYTQILKMEPRDKEALFALPKVRAWAKENCGKGKEPKIVQAIHKSLEEEDFAAAKQDIHLYESLYGKTLESTHFIALLSFKEMVKKEPHNADHWYRLARLYENHNDKMALVAAQKAVAIKPSDKNYTRLAEELEQRYSPQAPEVVEEVVIPCSPATHECTNECLSAPVFMSSSALWGSYYHESTSLTQTVEAIAFDCTTFCGSRLSAGVDLFQTRAKDKFIAVMGLGNYAGIDGQTTGSAETFWAGITNFWPAAESQVCLGAEHEQIQGLDRWTPFYALSVQSITGPLAAEFYSSYGYYLVSPRTLSLKLRQWYNALFLDYAFCNTHLIASVEVMANSDSNKQVDVIFAPQKSIFCLANWEAAVGFKGNWFFSRHEFQNGYYSPHVYQAYGGEVILDYFASPDITFTVEAFLGTQRDSFSSFWGPLVEIEFIETIDFCCDWHLDLFGDYSYLRQSRGSFNCFLIGAELVYQY